MRGSQGASNKVHPSKNTDGLIELAGLPSPINASSTSKAINDLEGESSEHTDVNSLNAEDMARYLATPRVQSTRK